MALFNIWIYQESANRLKPAQAASGLYPIKINISAELDRTPEGNRKRKMINTGEACSPEVFKAMYPTLGATVTSKMKKLAATAEVIEMKNKIEEFKNRYYNIVKDLTIDNNPQKIFTINQLVSAVNAANAVTLPIEQAMNTLEYHFKKYIVDNGEYLSKSHKVKIISALNCFLNYKNPLTLYDINKSFLTNWQKFMRNGQNFKDNKPRTLITIQGYAKILNTVLKEVVSNNFIGYKESMLPIGNNRKTQYQIPLPKKNEAKIPRYLDDEDLQKLKDYTPESPQEELSKDVWLLSYYLGGCNAIDLANFRKSNIQKEHQQLVWYRNKNKSKQSQTVSRVPLTDEALRLIEKYRIKGLAEIDWDRLPKVEATKLKRMYKAPASAVWAEMAKSSAITGAKGIFNDKVSTNYLLNFHLYSKNKENTSDNLRGFLNKKYLKDIAKKLNMKQSLNFQMARHTCFSNLQRSGASFAEILEISGHARVETLRNYLAALKPKNMKKVVDKL